MKVLNSNNTIGKHKEETVEELLAKLAQKGKKVKLLDESASVKELPRQEDDDEDLDRDDDDEDGESRSIMKNKINIIKDNRDKEESARKLQEQMEQQ